MKNYKKLLYDWKVPKIIKPAKYNKIKLLKS